MLIRLALILSLVLQPLLVLGALPCGDRQTEAAIAPGPEPCCCPGAAPQTTCATPAACGCAPADGSGSNEDSTPPGPSAERLLTIALIAEPTDIRPLSPARSAAPAATALPAFTGGSAQALFCVWRT